MKKSILYTILLCLCALVILTACDNDFSEIEIECSDVYDAPSGEYALPYKVLGYEDYLYKYNLSLSIKVYDKDNNSVEVTNNRTINVEKEQIYTVIVRVNAVIDNESKAKSKTFTVYAEHDVRKVVFYIETENTLEVMGTFTVKYGASFTQEEIPEVPNVYESAEGSSHYTQIISKRWVIKKGEEVVELTLDHLQNVTENIDIYSEYVYSYTPVVFTVSFETNGAGNIDSVQGTATDVLKEPATPQKEGYTFCGWYTDKDFKSPYNWTGSSKITKNMTLYAKWAKNVENATANKYFNYTLNVDEYGNEYYILGVKDIAVLEKNIIIPNNYNGYPVGRIDYNAFKNSTIETVYIPNTINVILSRAFFACESLTKVTFEEGSQLTFFDGGLFNGCVNLKEINIPSTLVTIRQSVFTNCKSLGEIVLPEGVTNIQSRAFYGCTALTEFILPDSCVTISEEVFMDCTALSVFTVSQNSALSYVYNNIFTNTAVTEITLPATMEENKPFEGVENITVYYHPPVEDEETDDTDEETDNTDEETSENN